MCDGNDGVIRSKVGILNSSLFHRRKHHGGRGKELLPVTMNKGDCGSAEAYNQVEGTFSISARRYSANAASGPALPERAAQKRMLCDL